MGFWDVIHWIGDGVKKFTPDLSPAKEATWATFKYSSAAVVKIDQTVRVNGIQKLPDYWPDGETRAQIGLFATKFAKNAAIYTVHEGFKHIPGATVASKLVSQTVDEVRRERHRDQIKAIQQKADKSEDFKKSISQAEMSAQDEKSSSQIACGGEKVENVIKEFMMTEFIGNHMLRDLMVPEFTRRENKKD